MNQIDNKKNSIRKYIFIACLSSCFILLGIFATFAYRMIDLGVEKPQELTVETGTMRLIFADGNPGFNAKLNFGESAVKTFTIENTGTLDVVAKINWKNLVNTYLIESLTYSLSYYEHDGDEPIEIETNKNVPKSEILVTKELSNGITIPSKKTYTFTLTITLNHLEQQIKQQI